MDVSLHRFLQVSDCFKVRQYITSNFPVFVWSEQSGLIVWLNVSGANLLDVNCVSQLTNKNLLSNKEHLSIFIDKFKDISLQGDKNLHHQEITLCRLDGSIIRRSAKIISCSISGYYIFVVNGSDNCKSLFESTALCYASEWIDLLGNSCSAVVRDFEGRVKNSTLGWSPFVRYSDLNLRVVSWSLKSEDSSLATIEIYCSNFSQETYNDVSNKIVDKSSHKALDQKNINTKSVITGSIAPMELGVVKVIDEVDQNFQSALHMNAKKLSNNSIRHQYTDKVIFYWRADTEGIITNLCDFAKLLFGLEKLEDKVTWQDILDKEIFLPVFKKLYDFSIPSNITKEYILNRGMWFIPVTLRATVLFSAEKEAVGYYGDGFFDCSKISLNFAQGYQTKSNS